MEIPGILYPFCNHNYTTNGTDFIYKSMVAVGIVSDTLAITGAIFIITTYFLFKNLKTRARQILTFIAFADLFNAIFYLIAQCYYIVKSNYPLCYPDKPIIETSVCVIQATANNLFTLLSFSFTIILSLHILFLTIEKNIFNKKFNYHISVILALCIPFLITSLAFWFGWFGPGETITIGLCFIRDISYDDSENIEKSAIYEFLTAKLWDISTVIIIGSVYTFIIFRCLWKRQGKHCLKNIGGKDIKICIIPIAFIFIRIWGDIHFAWTIMFPTSILPSPLLYLQAILEPSQGWANAVIYIFYTQKVRSRILQACSFRKRKNYQSINSMESFAEVN